MPKRKSKSRDRDRDRDPDHVIEVAIYGTQVSLWVGDAGESHPGAVALSIKADTPNSYGVILQADAGPGVIAHEALHLTNWICGELNIPNEPEDDEAAAYLLQYLTAELHALTRSDTI